MRSTYAFSQRLVAPIALLTVISLSVETRGQTVLFSDDFSVEASTFTAGAITGTDWTFVNDEVNQSDARLGFDYSSIAATDGSSILEIPEAPNSQPGDAPQRGASLRVNVSAGAADQAGIFIEDEAFTGQYQVQVDMYLSWAADNDQIGTTEHGGLFIGKDTPTNPASPDFPASTGAGAIFSSDGDTGQFDHAILKNNIYPSTESGQYSVTDFGDGIQLGYGNVDANADPAQGDIFDLPAIFPEVTTPSGVVQDAGVVGYRWITLTADVDTEALGDGTGTETGTTTFTVTEALSGESYTIGTLDNSVIVDLQDGSLLGQNTETEQGPVDMSGRVTLTMIDFFTSVASDINLATVIFDNLIVTSVDSVIGLEADFNGDGTVDLLDLDILGSNFGGPGGATTGDANDDGTVDLLDLDILGSQFGESVGAVAVPEPTAVVLCLVAAAFSARRRRA